MQAFTPNFFSLFLREFIIQVNGKMWCRRVGKCVKEASSGKTFLTKLFLLFIFTAFLSIALKPWMAERFCRDLGKYRYECCMDVHNVSVLIVQLMWLRWEKWNKTCTTISPAHFRVKRQPALKKNVHSFHAWDSSMDCCWYFISRFCAFVNISNGTS